MAGDPEYAARFLDGRKRRRKQRKYGISQEVYEEMVVVQGSRCLICKREVELVIDHDHGSGVVRGLLCRRCNAGLGYFKDNPVLLQRAIRYLMEMES
jgi:hypothetical protein